MRLGGFKPKVTPVLRHPQAFACSGDLGRGFGPAVARPRMMQRKHPDTMQEMLCPPKLLMHWSIDCGVKTQDVAEQTYGEKGLVCGWVGQQQRLLFHRVPADNLKAS
jgi:hypothetical protein